MSWESRIGKQLKGNQRTGCYYWDRIPVFYLYSLPPLLIIGHHHTNLMQEGSQWFQWGHKDVNIHRGDQSRKWGSNRWVAEEEVEGRRDRISLYLLSCLLNVHMSKDSIPQPEPAVCSKSQDSEPSVNNMKTFLYRSSRKKLIGRNALIAAIFKSQLYKWIDLPVGFNLLLLIGRSTGVRPHEQSWSWDNETQTASGVSWLLQNKLY